ncbi:MAG TPA: hypothetical protein GXX40_10025 [Firmicutes bacterium]|nr:hypothetical protein [Bacillota bacterium]
MNKDKNDRELIFPEREPSGEPYTATVPVLFQWVTPDEQRSRGRYLAEIAGEIEPKKPPTPMNPRKLTDLDGD